MGYPKITVSLPVLTAENALVKRELEGYQVSPHFLAHKPLLNQWNGWQPWVLTHIQTGLAIGTQIASLGLAACLAIDLEVVTDWDAIESSQSPPYFDRKYLIYQTVALNSRRN